MEVDSVTVGVRGGYRVICKGVVQRGVGVDSVTIVARGRDCVVCKDVVIGTGIEIDSITVGT